MNKNVNIKMNKESFQPLKKPTTIGGINKNINTTIGTIELLYIKYILSYILEFIHLYIT